MSGGWFGELTPAQKGAVQEQLASGASPKLLEQAVRQLGWLPGSGGLLSTPLASDSMPLVNGVQPDLKFVRDGRHLVLRHELDGMWVAACSEDGQDAAHGLGFITLTSALGVLAELGWQLGGCRG